MSSKDLQLSSLESNPAAKELKDFLRDLKESAACDVIKQVSLADWSCDGAGCSHSLALHKATSDV